MKKNILSVLICLLAFCIGSSFAVEVTILGPKQYLRKEGKPYVHEDTFPGEVGMGTFIIENGAIDGTNRVSSAIIKLNGQEICGTEDFNLEVRDLYIPVNLGENNTISVELRSTVGSYLTIEVKQMMDVEGGGAIGPYGGSIEITDPMSPICGVEIQIPEYALSSYEIITLSFIDEIEVPENIDILTSTAFTAEPSGLQFNEGVYMKIPYDENQIDEDQMIFVLINDNLRSLFPKWGIADTMEVNKDENYIVVRTEHFTDFIVSSTEIDWSKDYGGKWTYPDDTLTHNFIGSCIKCKNGVCRGIAAFSSWYYMYKKQGGTSYSLNCAYPHELRHEIAETAQLNLADNLLLPDDDLVWEVYKDPETPDLIAEQLIGYLKIGQPQVLLLKASADNYTHIVVVTNWVNLASNDSDINGYFEVFDSDVSTINEISYPVTLKYEKYGNNEGFFSSLDSLSEFDQFQREDMWISDVLWDLSDIFFEFEDRLINEYPEWNRDVECGKATDSITDPIGDANSNDLMSATITISGGFVNFEVHFAPGSFDEILTQAQILLDIDQNPATGHPGVNNGGIDDADIIGVDFLINLGPRATDYGAFIYEYTGSVNQFNFVARYEVTKLSDGFKATIPLNLFNNDDGNMNFKVTSSNQIDPYNGGTTMVSDYMPDIGLPAGIVKLW